MEQTPVRHADTTGFAPAEANASGATMDRNIIISTKYHLNRIIATGGMGTIYEADQFGVEGFVKKVAIKLLRPDLSANNEFVELFIGEARLVSRLVHQNIVQIYQLGQCDGGLFIAMEFIDGIDLEQFMARHAQLNRKIPVELVVYIISRICRGLEYAHHKKDEQGQLLDIVHRDVSPRNIMLTSEGEVKLTDFGVAKARRYMGDALRENVLVGKIAYMSPEQATYRPVDARSDIFSLGVVFYELLTGIDIFNRESETEAIKQITKGRIPDPGKERDGLPNEVTNILLKCLARDPRKRHQSAGDLGYALEYYMYSGGYGPTIVTLAKYLAEIYPERKFYVAPSGGDNLGSSVLKT